MKTKFFLFIGLLGIALTGTVFTGCKKDSTNPDSDITAAEDESNASNASQDTKNVSDAAAQNTSNEYRPEKNLNVLIGHCVVTFDDTASGSGYDTMYVNFGSSPVLCNDGRYRQGEIIVYWAKTGGTLLQAYLDSNNTISMTFRNFFRGKASNDMIGVTGLRTWTNTGKNAISEENWNFTANLTLSYNTGQTATWNSSRQNSLVLVGGVYYYEISGEATGTSRNGVGYTLTITSPLYVTALPWWLGGCSWIEAGTVNVNRTGKANTLTINFGNVGTCDDIATASIGGNNYTFTMP